VIRGVIKIGVIVIIVAGAFSYLGYLKTGRFWLPTISSNSLPNFARQPTFESLPQPTKPVYKWRENGRWVYGEKPPRDIEAEQVFSEYEEDVE